MKKLLLLFFVPSMVFGQVKTFNLNPLEREFLSSVGVDYVKPTFKDEILMTGDEFLTSTKWADYHSESINFKIMDVSKFNVVGIKEWGIPSNTPSFLVYEGQTFDPNIFKSVVLIEFHFYEENKLIPAIFLKTFEGKLMDTGVDFNHLIE
jgi:hypothetical protein